MPVLRPWCTPSAPLRCVSSAGRPRRAYPVHVPQAVERLDASTKKILFENRRMAEELRVQVQETDELQKASGAR